MSEGGELWEHPAKGEGATVDTSCKERGWQHRKAGMGRLNGMKRLHHFKGSDETFLQ
jgi:hypothetical protein